MKKLGKKSAAIILISSTITVAVLALGTTGCALNGTLNAACLLSYPIIYAVIVAATFIATIKIAHYAAEAAEYRRQNPETSLREYLKIAAKDKENLSIVEVLQTSIKLTAERIEEIMFENDVEDDEERSVKVLES